MIKNNCSIHEKIVFISWGIWIRLKMHIWFETGPLLPPSVNNTSNKPVSAMSNHRNTNTRPLSVKNKPKIKYCKKHWPKQIESNHMKQTYSEEMIQTSWILAISETKQLKEAFLRLHSFDLKNYCLRTHGL